MSSLDLTSASDRIRIVEERVLSDDWYLLKKTTFDYRPLTSTAARTGF